MMRRFEITALAVLMLSVTAPLGVHAEKAEAPAVAEEESAATAGAAEEQEVDSSKDSAADAAATEDAEEADDSVKKSDTDVSSSENLKETDSLKETEIPEISVEISDKEGELNLDQDRDDLYEEYAERLFYPDKGNGPQRIARRNNLTEKEKKICAAAKPKLADIANGKSNTSHLEIPISDFVDGYEPGKRYYGEDLIGQPIQYSFLTGQWENSDEAFEAMSAQLTFDLGAIGSCLTADCPYELYWMQHAYNCSFPQTSIQYDEERGEGYAVYTGDTITISFEVESKYRLDASDSYSVDTGKTSVASRAADNAKKIVANAAEQSDYEKLCTYRDTICNLVDYNHAAANRSDSSSDSMDMGPWALIYVFDEDPSTNVVCEGYAEAFQYLCDITEFTSPEIAVYSVTGKMSGEGHKWNIVTMDNGKNYLVDVTNCDTGSVGYPDKLFLVGGEPAGTNSITVTQNEESKTLSAPAYCFEGCTYSYDGNSLRLYPEDELTLSEKNYAEETEQPQEKVKLVANSLSLSGDIAVKYFLQMDDSVLKDSGAYMYFDIRTRKVRIPLSQGTPCYLDGTKVYAYSCAASSSEMTYTIQATVVQGDGTKTKLRDYSVRQYAENMLNSGAYASDTKLQVLLKAMLNYGGYSQQYFNRRMDDLANSDLDADTVDVSEVTTDAFAANQCQLSGSVEGISYYGSSLMLKSRTGVRHYFRLENGHDIGEYTFWADGIALNPVKTSPELYYVELGNISAAKIGSNSTLSVRSGNSSLSLQYGPFSYAFHVLSEQTGSLNLQNLLRSLYQYEEAAKAYVS